MTATDLTHASTSFISERYPFALAAARDAFYESAIRLRRGDAYRTDAGWRGDVVAPMIRDLGAARAMRPGPVTIRMVLSAQMGKAGPPMDDKDLHVGDFVSALTVAGLAMAFAWAAERARAFIEQSACPERYLTPLIALIEEAAGHGRGRRP